MKSIVCSLSVLFVIAMLPFTAVAQYQDDLYRRPSSSKKTEKTVKSQTEEVVQPASTAVYASAAADAYVPDSVWDVDAYNRRYTSTTETPYEEEGEEVEDTASEDEEVGFYLIGYYGTKSDLEYAERIRKFHDPDFIIHLTDSAYNTVYYVDSFDGDIYINGSYVYGYPDPWYWDYYAPYYWGWGAWG
ncbi:MAG: hypothetical protein LUI04_05305, partial [Porphyromonadaceae bacterium]|nr:hypothetical protein [Porphyromonadaceae bacterium]